MTDVTLETRDRTYTRQQSVKPTKTGGLVFYIAAKEYKERKGRRQRNTTQVALVTRLVRVRFRGFEHRITFRLCPNMLTQTPERYYPQCSYC